MRNDDPAPHAQAPLPGTPAPDLSLTAAQLPRPYRPLERRVLWISALALVIGLTAGLAKLALSRP